MRGSRARPASRRASAIPSCLNIHGGPFTQYGNGFFDETQVYAGGGYAVLVLEPARLVGLLRGLGPRDHGPGELGPGWGTVDYEDLMAVADDGRSKRFDFCDPERHGRARRLVRRLHDVLDRRAHEPLQGGVLRSAPSTTSSRCTARATSAGSSRATTATSSTTTVDTYLQMSPWTYAKQIETPLLILHSENDLRCNIEQGEQLFTTLRLLKKDVEMVRFPVESHELIALGQSRAPRDSASSSCSSGSTATSSSSAVDRTPEHQRAASARTRRRLRELQAMLNRATTEAPPTPPPAPLPSRADVR